MCGQTKHNENRTIMEKCLSQSSATRQAQIHMLMYEVQPSIRPSTSQQKTYLPI